MKYMKKWVGMLLTMLMLFTLAAPGFASESGSITVLDAKDTETYTAYKIFDVTYDGDAYAYSISENSEWKSVVDAYDGVTLKKNSNGGYNVMQNEKFSAVDFADTLSKALDGKTGVPLAYNAGEKSAKASNLPLGYYLVDTTSGALCNLTTTNPNASVRDKNDVPFDFSDKGTTSVAVGEKVPYLMTGKVPDTTGFEKLDYTYTISATLPDGVTYDKNAVVTVGEETIAATITTNENGFEVMLDVKAIQDKVGEKIEIHFTGTVNSDAVAVESMASATLTYSSDPAHKQVTSQTLTDSVYSSEIVINKYDATNSEKKLENAVFVLLNEDKKYLALDENGVVSWVDEIDQAQTFTTDKAGAVIIPGLKEGTYSLHEKEAPQGYNLLEKDKDVVVKANVDTNNNVIIDSLTVKADVANSTGTIMPSTGGIGTTIFYVIGSILVLGAGILLVLRRRMQMDE